MTSIANMRKANSKSPNTPRTPNQIQHQPHNCPHAPIKKQQQTITNIRKNAKQKQSSQNTKQKTFPQNAKHGCFKQRVGGINPSQYFQTYIAKKNGTINYNMIVKIVSKLIKQNQKHFFKETRNKHIKNLQKYANIHVTERQKSMRPYSNSGHITQMYAAHARKNGVKKAERNFKRFRQLSL